jgi:hypothetical protein
MSKLKIGYNDPNSKTGSVTGYHYQAAFESYLFPDRQANVILNGQNIGVIFFTLHRLLGLFILKS